LTQDTHKQEELTEERIREIIREEIRSAEVAKKKRAEDFDKKTKGSMLFGG